MSRDLDREAMVRVQLAPRSIVDPQVLRAMGTVARERFVPEALTAAAYEDRALPIGHHATLSQPFVVAYMSQVARVRPGTRLLDVGTGSGYQAAIAAELGADVFGVEIVGALAARARETLTQLGYIGASARGRVEIRRGDGYRGWPEHAPYDAIIVAAATPEIPRPLLEQLGPGGRMVLPVGDEGRGHQTLVLLERGADGVRRRDLFDVAFVPMTGEVAAS